MHRGSQEQQLHLLQRISSRLVQVRAKETKWPLEYSRKKWFLGPPKLPPEILEWERQLEQARQEKLEALQEDVVPPFPKVRGSSHIAVRVPRIPNFPMENPDPVSDEQKMDQLIAYYRELAEYGTVPQKTLGVKMAFKDYAYLFMQAGEDGDIVRGKWGHAHALSHGYRPSRYIGNCLMAMYNKRGYIHESQRVFDEIVWKNIFSWTILMKGYAEYGEYETAIKIFRRMLLERTDKPNDFSFSCALSCFGATGNLLEGKKLHCFASEAKLDRDVTVCNALISMYGKCGAVREAEEVFCSMQDRNVVTWNAMLSAYAQNGLTELAQECLPKMEVEGVTPDITTFVGLLEAFPVSSKYIPSKAKWIHKRMFDLGLDESSRTALVKMYGHCGFVDDAEEMFNSITHKGSIAWTVMVMVFTRNGYQYEAFLCFRRMLLEGVEPKRYTLVELMNSCRSSKDIDTARQISVFLEEPQFYSDTMVYNSLVDVFGKFGSLDEAIGVFDRMPLRNLVSWNALIFAMVNHGEFEQIYKIYKRILHEGEKPDRISFVGALDGCAMLGDASHGRDLHHHVIEAGMKNDGMIRNALIYMYGRCRRPDKAKLVFDRTGEKDIMTWNALVTASSKNSVFGFLRNMDLEGLKADQTTYLALVDACGVLGDLHTAKTAHSRISQSHDYHRLKLALIDMYGKCGSLTDANEVFNSIEHKDEDSWMAMVVTSSGNGACTDSLKLLRGMCVEGLKPSRVAYASVLDSCQSELHLKTVSSHIIENSIWDVFLETAISIAYSRLGRLPKAMELFTRSVDVHSEPFPWNALISAHVHNGAPLEALKLLQRMDNQGVKPNNATFMGFLEACGSLKDAHLGGKLFKRVLYSGLVPDENLQTSLLNMYTNCEDLDRARTVFDEMKERSISWSLMVSVYALKGNVVEALQLFYAMVNAGVHPDKLAFVGVLRACNHVAMVDDACRCFYSLRYDYGMSPSEEHVQVMMELLTRAGYMEEAQLVSSNSDVDSTVAASVCRRYGDGYDWASSYLILPRIYGEVDYDVSLSRGWEGVYGEVNPVEDDEDRVIAISNLATMSRGSRKECINM